MMTDLWKAITYDRTGKSGISFINKQYYYEYIL